MRNAVVAVLVLLVSLGLRADALGQTHHPGERGVAGAITPPSLEMEHKTIHEALLEATKAPGQVGAAAKELAALLHGHFERESEIALPPLGLLAPLAAGEKPPGMEKALAMSDALRKELPKMLEEHKQIRAATEKLRTAAQAEKQSAHEQFAKDLALHAQTEEEVLYPAAILVGDLVRARMKDK